MRWARRLLTFELRLVRSLVLVALRRADGVGPGDVPLPYARADTPTAVLFLGLSVAELLVVELVVPWPAARHVLLLLGLWGLLVVAGLVAMQWTHPHVVRRDALLVRSGGLVTVQVPREAIAAVERRQRHGHSAWAIDDGHLYLPVAGTTSLDVVLARPLAVRVGRRSGTVERISVAVDEPAVALRALQDLTPRKGRW